MSGKLPAYQAEHASNIPWWTNAREDYLSE